MDGEALREYLERVVDVQKYWDKCKIVPLFSFACGNVDWDQNQITLCHCIDRCDILRRR